MIAGAAQRRRPWAALGNPNYRLWFGGMLISQTGGWMQRTAQAWLGETIVVNAALCLVGVALGAIVFRRRRQRAYAARSADARPIDTRPIDTRPIDTRPIDTRPIDTRPIDTRPI